MPNYPDIQGYAYTFERGELTAAGRIFTAIKNVKVDQPTEEGVVMGTRPYPLMRTEGAMKMGDGSLEFSDVGEAEVFFDRLGNFYRTKVWTVLWYLTARGKPPIIYKAFGCRVLSDPIDHSSGNEALGSSVNFSFMYMHRNGKVPHLGLPSF